MNRIINLAGRNRFSLSWALLGPQSSSSPRSNFLHRNQSFATRTAAWMHRHNFATSLSSDSNKDLHADDGERINEPELVLYQKQTPNTVLQSGLICSSVHTCYWIWYAVDFVPRVNASPMPELHIDPMLGLAGLLAATIMQTVFVLYPWQLVSRLSYLPTSRQLAVYNHVIWPRVQARRPVPVLVAPLGQIRLDAASAEASQILNDLGGDLDRFRGHLPIAKQSQWPPYVINIQQHEVLEPRTMLQALLAPDELRKANNQQHLSSLATRGWRQRDDHDATAPAAVDDDENSTYIPLAVRRPQRRYGARPHSRHHGGGGSGSSGGHHHPGSASVGPATSLSPYKRRSRPRR